ncbi:trans-sulfuration enzyme family protein [Waddlia chondrophila]|uniref:Cystathionine gamma-lyase n=1 Tax=Waddlia chondrophila (strain ATCC VR-1470 / WSU 86-1044) TaxID=716544 RepID=D6YWJ1_WADCW|nr:PLP-dependent aspartate aminotransferase family protein [Waddlia chondrophila]ADI38502.1 cystathionine gamma-lyase [Waddlia chondrophila WSU 86-1044]
MKFKTLAIHKGSKPDAETGAVMPPVYLTSTFEQNTPGQTRGYDYTRGGNPNFTRLESLLASLENGKYATVFSSGLGALSAMAAMLKSGDQVVALNGLYGGTYRFFTQIMQKQGIAFEVIDVKDIDRALAQKPAWLLFETPTNPLLDIYDIKRLCAHANALGVLTIVDNTFATPYFQNPLQLGASVVWHSTTKYIGGHSDVVGGALITNSQQLNEQFSFNRLSIGVNPSPFDAWLTMRGVKTLALRMEQHQKNALALADFLSGHPLVKKIYYPGIETHPNHEVAKQQMSGFSGIVSAEFNLSLEQTLKLISRFSLFTLAESLGGVESLVNHPATMTHASIPREKRLKMGISDGLIRFSLGIEDAEDLIKDVKTQLEKFSLNPS